MEDSNTATLDAPIEKPKRARAKKPPATKPKARGPRAPKEPLVIQQEKDVDSMSGQKEWVDVIPVEGTPPFMTEQDAKRYLLKQAIDGTFRLCRYSKPITVAIQVKRTATFE